MVRLKRICMRLWSSSATISGLCSSFTKRITTYLNEEDEKVKALAPIKDPTLLQETRDYRKIE